MDNSDNLSLNKQGSAEPIIFAFFLSGFAALTYQLAWQRALYRIYGINTESVTIIVSAFMFGLGMGDLFGGWFSTRKNINKLFAFALFEIGIALFGIFSLSIFEVLGGLTVKASWLETMVSAFLLVLIPTFLMGATLPILLADLSNRLGSVGLSLSRLYYINTFGSAVSALLSISFLFKYLGLSGSVTAAVILNLATAVIIMAFCFNNRPQK